MKMADKNAIQARNFTVKFIIHSFSDITQNLAVFTLLLTINLVIIEFKNNSPTLP